MPPTNTDSPFIRRSPWSSVSVTPLISRTCFISCMGRWCRRLVLGLKDRRQDSTVPSGWRMSMVRPALFVFSRLSCTSWGSSVPMYSFKSGYRLQHSMLSTGFPSGDSTSRMQAGVSKLMPSKLVRMSSTADSCPLSKRAVPISPNDSGVMPMRASCCQSTCSMLHFVDCCGAGSSVAGACRKSCFCTCCSGSNLYPSIMAAFSSGLRNKSAISLAAASSSAGMW